MTTQWNFKHSKLDFSLFYRWDADHILLVLAYIDDIIITGSNQSVSKVISAMRDTFARKDLGELYYLLGIEVNKTKEGVHLS